MVALERKTCTCGVQIVMRKHERTGKVSPITVDESEKGNIGVNEDGSFFIAKAEYTGPRFLNHFTDCPDAELYGGVKPGNPAYRGQTARQSGFDLPGMGKDRYLD